MRSCLLLFFVVTLGASCGEPHRERVDGGIISSMLYSNEFLSVGDWPGFNRPVYEVFRLDGGEFRPWPCVGPSEIDSNRWECDVGPISGVFRVVDRRPQEPDVQPLEILLIIEVVGDTVDAYVSPVGHLISQAARHRQVQDGVGYEQAINSARAQFSTVLLNPLYPHTSPDSFISNGVSSLERDGEKQAFILTAMTRVVEKRYGTLPSAHKTRLVTTALGAGLRENGEFRLGGAFVPTATGSIAVSREFLRHELALEVLELALERPLELTMTEARALAEQINGQSGELFGFSAAPPIP